MKLDLLSLHKEQQQYESVTRALYQLNNIAIMARYFPHPQVDMTQTIT